MAEIGLKALHLVRDVRIDPLILLHGVAHGDVQAVARSGGGRTASWHVYVGQNVGIRDAVGHGSFCRIVALSTLCSKICRTARTRGRSFD